MRILITEVANFASIGLIKLLRMLKDYEIEIIGSSKYKKGFTSGSILVDEFYQLSSINDNGYVNDLLRILKTKKIDCIISTDEDELLKLTTINNKIESVCILPSNNILKIFRDKENATLFLKNIGINTPKIIKDLCEYKKNDLPKIIFRKKTSVGSKGIKVFDLKEDKYIENLFSDEYFIQEYITGEEFTVDVFCDNDGNPKLIIPRKRLDIRNGISYKCQIIFNNNIIEECKKIYANYKIPGFSNVQFILKDNIAYFIELNPRFAGTGIASSIASFNILSLFIDHFILKKQLKSIDYYMQFVCWNSIITRYYDEVIYNELQY